MEYVDIDGLRVAYRRRGEGPGLVLLHGAVSDSRVWRVELDSLADTFTVVAWDAPGCGGSSDPPEHFRLTEYADCLAGFVTALGLDEVHVLGHSWGSALALALCLHHPRIVGSLVLVGAYAGWAGSLPPEQVAERLELALRVADTATDGFEPASIPGLFSDAMPTERRMELAAIMSAIRPAGTRAMARALAEADLRDVLARITVPTLLIHGDADERSTSDIARTLHASIPGSTLTVLSGLGHECFMESPERFDAAIRPFLRELESRNRRASGSAGVDSYSRPARNASRQSFT